MRKFPHKINQVIAQAILIILVGVNFAWYVITKQSGSLVALIFYSVIFFLFWRLLDFRAGITAGVIGFGVHLYELVSLGISAFQLLDTILFYLNLVLPIPLAYFSYRAYRASR
jgi:hypothetical protein